MCAARQPANRSKRSALPCAIFARSADDIGSASRRMNDVRGTYSKASPITGERCVFDIRGRDYRLNVAFKFSARIAFVKFIGTHTRYNRVDRRDRFRVLGVSMAIRPIRTEKDYRAAVTRIEALWDARPGRSTTKSRCSPFWSRPMKR